APPAAPAPRLFVSVVARSLWTVPSSTCGLTGASWATAWAMPSAAKAVVARRSLRIFLSSFRSLGRSCPSPHKPVKAVGVPDFGRQTIMQGAGSALLTAFPVGRLVHHLVQHFADQAADRLD